MLDAAGRVSAWKLGRRGKGGSRKEKGNKESRRERRRRRKKTQQTPKSLSIKYTSAFIRYSVLGIILKMFPPYSPQAACDPARLNTQLITKPTYLKHKQLCKLDVKS